MKNKTFKRIVFGRVVTITIGTEESCSVPRNGGPRKVVSFVRFEGGGQNQSHQCLNILDDAVLLRFAATALSNCRHGFMVSSGCNTVEKPRHIFRDILLGRRENTSSLKGS